MRPPGRRRPGLVLLLLAALVLPALAGMPSPARAAEYTMETRATYAVQPEDRRVSVSVHVIFENTTPNPSGEFSVFEVIDLAIQPGATNVRARDSRGELTVTETERDGYIQASVRPRREVRFEQRSGFTLSYRIPDGAAPGTRVRPSLVAFPVWSFGTAGEVIVNVPGSYEVSVAGDALTAERTAGGWQLESGEIDDPAAWVSQVIAAGEAGLATSARAVPLESGTVDLQVRAWADDEAWGERTLRLVADALPRLEAALGLPYPGGGPLVIEESAGASADLPSEPSADGTRLLAGYDQPAFMLLHQLGHVWLASDLVADRWIAEGFASRAAALVAGELGDGADAEPPYDPAQRRRSLVDDAFPLVSWGAGEATTTQDAFAYAASWAVADEIAAAVGEDALLVAWARIAAGTSPYAPVADGDAADPIPSPALQPVDSRALLDHLEAVSGADLARLFERWVLDDGTAALLAARTAAREDHERLLTAAAGWGAPEPVLVDLEAWRFDEAGVRIGETLDWLADRDRLVAAAEAAGLALPQRLRDRYRTGGGSDEARAELDAELAVVTAYQATLERAASERGVLERIGLVGGPEPDELLASANALFAEGDLRAAADTVDQARSRLEHAATEGLVRLGAAVALLAGLLIGAWTVLRRNRLRPPSERSGTDYTAAP